MKEKIAKVLREARDLMNDSGAHWTRYDLRTRIFDQEEGTYAPDEYAYCSAGAIFSVTGAPLDKLVSFDEAERIVYANKEKSDELLKEGDVELRTETVKALYEEVLRSGFVPPVWHTAPPTEYDKWLWTITSWNDRGDREWPDVAEMFENAAASVEAGDGLV